MKLLTELVYCRLPCAYAHWLHWFLPGIPEDDGAEWLEPVVVTGKLVHLSGGLNLSHALML